MCSSRRGAGEQEHDAGHKGQRRENPRRQPLRHACDGARQACGIRLRSASAQQVMAVLADLGAGQDDEGNRERREVVDDPIRHERRRQLHRRHVRLQQQHDHTFEYADAAGHVRGESENLRREERAQHHHEGRCTAWQQHVQHGARQRPIHRREQQLQYGQASRRQRQLESPHADRTGAKRGRDDVGRADGQEQHANRRRHGSQRHIGEQRAEHEAQAAKREQPEPEGHRVPDHDLRELLSRNAPARIEAIAHGCAGQHREADAVGDRVGEKRGDRDVQAREPRPAEAARRRTSDRCQSDEVVAGENGVVECGEQECHTDQPRRRAERASRQRLPGDAVQLAAQHLECSDEENERHDRRQHPAKPVDAGRYVRGGFCFTHSIDSSNRRSNSGTFPLNRWSEAVTIHNRFGSLARAISFRTSDSGTNSSRVE